MYSIIAFYKFVRLPSNRVQEVKSILTNWAVTNHLFGLVILGPEGINATMSAEPEILERFKKQLLAIPEFTGIIFKHSKAEKKPFKRFKVKLRPEIVTIKNEDYFAATNNNHLTPTEWNQTLATEDYVLIDTRNDYEVELGTFEGAIDPKLKMFSEFPDYVRNSAIPKNKKVLMFCTGGIRCEKAIYEMQSQGYESVYQLEGGILKYLEEYPNHKFKGDCFVFDHRVALNQNLEPSQVVHLCPHCGNPGRLVTTCKECSGVAKICDRCQPTEKFQTCSKNCSYHYNLRINKPIDQSV